ncbi:MAG: amidase [Anaerolineae bacterium CG_4_9_14_0_8_um_filter_58_9]|nr:MAG: amidase [Anaerolineae bacterium CG_4_9_14_0_8_um_filter_58_9]
MKNKTTQNPEYDLKSVKLPYLAGGMLRLFVKLVEGPLRSLLIPSLFKSSGITWLREQRFDEPPTPQPVNYSATLAVEAQAVPQEEWPGAPSLPGLGFRYSTVQDYAEAYREGKITPEDVAHRVIEAIVTSNAAEPPLRAIIAMDREDVLRQAREATKRIKAGGALSVFDGVPVAVKDEVDMTPYPTSVGTAFLGKSPCKEDSTVVARMRAAGALLIGKANMHEIGIGVTGLNPHHGTPRNPYAPDHFTGGSSSGPGAAVAAGLCPAAIAADGGGSIRIPASFCGIVGIKPTFGRISEHGAAPLCWSVAHLGPVAATATDAALAYAVMAGPDPKDPNSLRQPAPTLADWDKLDLSGLTLGVYWPWFRHATADVVAACEAMLNKFESMGAQLREVVIPDLEAGRVAHTITIAGEMAQALDHTYAEHHREHGADVRINLALARAFTTMDYVQAQRVRTRLIANFARVLEQVDVILTPSTALPAPLIPKAALPEGESDLSTLVEIMRFATPANLAGLPAISFPVGYNEASLPLGMQAIGRAWQEATLLRLALAAERVVDRKPPQIHYRILPE